MKRTLPFLYSAATIAGVLAALLWLQPHLNVAAAGLILVTVVTLCSVLWGSGPGLVAALVGVSGLNYYFIPPLHTFAIAGTENWIAFIVFACCALIVGQLSARAQDRLARLEDEQARAKLLHEELQAAGVDVMLDDRGERPGAMFADWELIGVPHRVVISDRGLKDGKVEYQGRRDAQASTLVLGGLSSVLSAKLAA